MSEHYIIVVAPRWYYFIGPFPTLEAAEAYECDDLNHPEYTHAYMFFPEGIGNASSPAPRPPVDLRRI